MPLYPNPLIGLAQGLRGKSVSPVTYLKELAASGDSRMADGAHPVNVYCDSYRTSTTNDRSAIRGGKTLGRTSMIGDTTTNSVYGDLSNLIAAKAKVYYISAGYANDIVNGAAPSDIITAMGDISDRLHLAVPGTKVIWDDGVRLSSISSPGYDAKWMTVNSGLQTLLDAGRIEAIIYVSHHPVLSAPGAGEDISLFVYPSSYQHSTGLPGFYTRHQAIAFPVLNAALLSWTGNNPDAYTFQNQTNAVASTVIEGQVILSGMGPGRHVTVSADGPFSVGQSAFDATNKEAYDGDVVRARVSSSASSGGTATRTITAGTRSSTFTVTTAANGPAPTLLSDNSYAMFLNSGNPQAFTGMVHTGGRLVVWHDRNGAGATTMKATFGGTDYPMSIVAGASNVRQSLWMTGGNVPSGTGAVTVNGAYATNGTVCWASVANVTTLGSATYYTRGATNPGDYAAPDTITIPSGGRMLVFAAGGTFTGTTVATQNSKDGDGNNLNVGWYTTSTSQQPVLHVPAFCSFAGVYAIEVH